MYTLANLDVSELSRVKIKNQDKIIKLTGIKFVPLKAYEIIKEETNSFTEENEKARGAETLFTQLLERNGIRLPKPEDDELELIRVRERERKRTLELLQLKLRLQAKKES